MKARPQAQGESPAQTGELLEISDLQVEVGPRRRSHLVVRGITLSVGRAEMVGIVGESGSGKSLTALSVMGLLPSGVRIRSGSIRFEGRELIGMPRRHLAAIRGRHVAMIFQDPMTSLNPIVRVGAQVAEPARLHHLANRAKSRELAEGLLKGVGIPEPHDRMSRYPHEFSGGMRQRAMVAMSLTAGPNLIIADEPTTALDVTVQAQVLSLLKRLHRERGTAIILISHDLGVVAETCERIAVVYAGRIVEIGRTEQLLREPQHPYTRALLAAVPRPDAEPGTRLQAIGGEPPNMEDLPAGCKFNPRCSYRVDRCMVEEPPLLEVAGTRSACWVAQDRKLPPMEVEQDA
ncbi:ABC transporter ATP-binding protein [bacterium]|nr:MAG: ABC transporter ATP-binding protein [bacterium]